MKSHARTLVSLAGMALLTALPASPALGQTGQAEETQGVTTLTLRAQDGRIIAETEGGQTLTANKLKVEGADGSVVQTLSARGDLLHAAYNLALVQTPKVQIGVTMEPVAGALAAQLGLESESAVLISGVTEGQPAAKAGLKQHDVVTAVNGESPVTPKTFRDAVSAVSPGDTITLDVVRGGKRLTVKVEVEAFSQPKLTTNDLAYTYLAGRALRGLDVTTTVEPTIEIPDLVTTLNRPVQLEPVVTIANPHVYNKIPLLSYHVNRGAEVDAELLLNMTPVVVEGQVTLMPRVTEQQKAVSELDETQLSAALAAEVRSLKAQLERIENLLEKLGSRRD